MNDISLEKANLERELKHFQQVDLKKKLALTSQLVEKSIKLLGTSSHEFQFEIEQYLRGYVKLYGYHVNSVIINYRAPKSRDSQETHTTRSFPLENVQRSHHYCEESLTELKKMEMRKESYSLNELKKKLEECIFPLQNAISQMVIPFKGIYSSFPHLDDVLPVDTIRKMQNLYEPILKREIVVEFSVFEGKLITALHQLRSANRKRINELKNRSGGRFVTFINDKSSKVLYLKRSFHNKYEIQFFREAIELIEESANILERLKTKVGIFSSMLMD